MFGLFDRERVYCPYCLENTGSLQPVELVTVGGEIVKNDKGDHTHACTSCDEEVAYRHRITNEYLTMILILAMGDEKMKVAAKAFREALDYAEENKGEEIEAMKKRIQNGTHRPGEVMTALLTGNMPAISKKEMVTEADERQGIFSRKKKPQ